MVEKPSVEKSPSNLAFAGRYILTPEVFHALDDTEPGVNNEVQLTDALKILNLRESVYACIIEGKRYDIGNKLDYLKTIVEFGLKRKEFKEPFRDFLSEIINNDS